MALSTFESREKWRRKLRCKVRSQVMREEERWVAARGGSGAAFSNWSETASVERKTIYMFIESLQVVKIIAH